VIEGNPPDAATGTRFRFRTATILRRMRSQRPRERGSSGCGVSLLNAGFWHVGSIEVYQNYSGPAIG
jgi:hypothetical protein